MRALTAELRKAAERVEEEEGVQPPSAGPR